MKELGRYSILHTDGMLDPIPDELADSGLDALQAIGPIAGMDIGKTKQAVGSRLCLCGNLDCGLLQFGPPDRIYETARNAVLAAKPGGGFVLGGSDAVFKEIPLEHYQAMLQAWPDVGRY
ncbi:MAG: uroporphyrinogen decarboxylase family protein [Armatimonadota bacterium]